MTIDLHNVHVHLIDQGAGPPVLFLHGNPDTAELWRGIVSRLEGSYRCLAPDLPGFGRSTVTGDVNRWHNYAYEVEFLSRDPRGGKLSAFSGPLSVDSKSTSDNFQELFVRHDEV